MPSPRAPANILVGELGETIVIDWGLAKVSGDADAASSGGFSANANAALETHAGSVFGTPGFMAPEQLRGESVDARCDVYALGATLYYLLSRRPPHTGRTGAEMMVAALAGPVPAWPRSAASAPWWSPTRAAPGWLTTTWAPRTPSPGTAPTSSAAATGR